MESQSSPTIETIIDALYLHVKNKPEEIIYTFINDDLTEKTLTYKQLLQKSQAIAATLQAKNIKPRSRVLLIYSPGLEFICAFLGCLMAGVIAVPAFPPINSAFAYKLKGILSDAKPDLILTETKIKRFIALGKILKKINKIPFLKGFIEKKYKNIISATESSLEKYTNYSSSTISLAKAKKMKINKILPCDIALLQYTSGSTATPKGVMVLHRNIIANERLIAKYFGHSEQSVGVNWLPHYHDMGLIGTILQPLFVGFHSVLMSPITFLKKPTLWLNLIIKFQATTSGSPNFAYQLCAKKYKKITEKMNDEDFILWRVAFNGAEPIYPEVMLDFYEKFKNNGFRFETFLPCYGLAEATLIVAGIPFNEKPRILHIDSDQLKKNKVKLSSQDNAKKIASSGYCIEEIKIVNPETYNQCGNDEVGEIWIHGESVTHGYWQKPTETKITFHAKIAHDSSEKEYLRSGDLGFIHEQQLYVTGRAKDTIIIDGENYYPQDIEYTVINNFKEIRSGGVAVFSYEEETQVRIIIIAELCHKSKNTQNNLAELILKIKKCVFKYNGVPIARIVLVNPKAIAKTTSGKVSRAECKKLFLENKIDIIHQA